jgi:transketolase
MTSPLNRQIRQVILDQSKRAGVGHIGSALSIADIVAALYSGVLRVGEKSEQTRDRFILSKGHASLAVYAALHLTGWLSAAELQTYCGDGTLLGVHPERELRGVDFCSGSLGQGLPIGAGCALAARMMGSAHRTFVLMSDAECNEGSVWEAALFAAHHQLSSLVAIVDANGQQALGRSLEVLSMEPFAAKWTAFGWNVHEVDGNDEGALRELFEGLDTASGAPHLVCAKTTFGKGVSYMENQVKWHYWPMSDAEYQQAVEEQKDRP